jgi:hypothetical protein
LLGERVSVVNAIGIAFCLLGVALISYRSRGDLLGLLVPRITAQRVHAARIPLSTPTITPDPSSVSLPLKKTVDYVHSVCVAIYGFNSIIVILGITCLFLSPLR